MPLTLPGPPLLGSAPIPHAALFLDFDGTLVEIAPTPDSIAVPPEVPALLEAVAARLGGALAIVSGRTLAELDRYLPGTLAKAAEHGAALRPAADAPVERPPLPLPPAQWRAAAAALVARHPGALIEDKAHGFVVHFRLAPSAGPPAERLLRRQVATDAARFDLLPAHMAWEVRPRGPSKAGAVRRLLRDPPFAARTPVFVGDDVTDEEGMDACREAGGFGFRLDAAFGSPAALRDWLRAALTP